MSNFKVYIVGVEIFCANCECGVDDVDEREFCANF